MTKEDKIRGEIYNFLAEETLFFSTSIKNTFTYRRLTVKETKEKIIKLAKKIAKKLKKEK